jgi:flagellar basal body-associated protein FliL
MPRLFLNFEEIVSLANGNSEEQSEVLESSIIIIYILIIIIIITYYLYIYIHYGRGVDSASNRNEYQENFLGVNAAGA